MKDQKDRDNGREIEIEQRKIDRWIATRRERERERERGRTGLLRKIWIIKNKYLNGNCP